MATRDGVPVSGVAVTADYYKPDDSEFYFGQTFTELEKAAVGTGIYYNDFVIPTNADLVLIIRG